MANGRAYVVTDRGLRVYEASTGKLVGVDKSVENIGNDTNALWENKMIYFDNNYETQTATLTAISTEY